MARNIIIVNATQIVISESNPYGIFSTMTGFPKVFDSGTSGDIERNMNNAKAAYFDQLSKNYANMNPNRVMTTVTLESATGQQILQQSIGAIPDVIQPEPESEE